MAARAKKAKGVKRPAGKVVSRTASSPSADYHHGDLAAILRESALAILQEEGLANLSLRSLAKRAGVSHAAPYRHYSSREALLADLAHEGLRQLHAAVVQAAAAPGGLSDRIAHIGGTYVHFAAQHSGLLRLMFGNELPNKDAFPDLVQASDAIGRDIGDALGDPVLGFAVWASSHGLAMLILDNAIDLGQRQSGLAVVPSRAELVLRSLFAFADR